MQPLDLKLYHIEQKTKAISELKGLNAGTFAIGKGITDAALVLENRILFHSSAIVLIDSMVSRMTGVVIRNPDMPPSEQKQGRRRKDTPQTK